MSSMAAGYFSGKKAVITGAGDGIGRALAQQLNAMGCELWLCDIDSGRLVATLESLNTLKAAVHTEVVDCGNQDAIVAWGRAVATETPSIDAVFNNAGVAYAAPFADASEESFQWLMAINFWGVVWSTRAFLPLLKAAPVGHLVNVSSIFGMIGVAGQSAYNSAKFAVRGFTEALQAEYRNSSIKVSCVHPGGVATNIAKRARADGEWALSNAEERDAQFRQAAKTTPEKAAEIILRRAAVSTPRIFVGWDARIMHWLTKIFPTSYHVFIERLGQSNESK
jgi:NAD(P)-dependent dehydrogenase (short-subunit alcohol dehydrogenase family)